jgi:hypothetical protein
MLPAAALALHRPAIGARESNVDPVRGASRVAARSGRRATAHDSRDHPAALQNAHVGDAAAGDQQFGCAEHVGGE